MPLGPILLLGLLAPPAAAGEAVIDDSDISGPPAPRPAGLDREGREEGAAWVFGAQRLSRPAAPMPAPAVPSVFGEILLTDPQGRELPARRVGVSLAGAQVLAQGETDESGRFVLPVPPGSRGTAAVRFRLENRHWSLREPRRDKPYEWEAGTVQIPESGSTNAGSFRLDPQSQNGRIGFIHLQFLEALALFAREGSGVDWWGRQLKVNYPGSADYFSPWGFSLDLTRPEAWDVNLHELGHAVLAAGTRSRGGGGEHYIDRCYNRGLAWSEGFATFFAGAVRLARGDPDARFEFLVPRRAPIRIENVPDDVCAGDTNEWRVAAGLWDLYDSNADGSDASALPFGRLWGAIQGRSMGGLPDAWQHIRAALSPEEQSSAAAALAHNTLAPGAPEPPAPAWETGSRPEPWAAGVPRSGGCATAPGGGLGRLADRLSGPDWDGSAPRAFPPVPFP